MMLIRDVARSDLQGLKRLAAILNTVNLPNDEASLQKIIDTSIRSFSKRIREPLSREYLFVLEDLKTRRIVGTSMIIAQHGTKDSPHVSLEVSRRETYSSTLDRHFKHTVLSIVSNYDGPTEIGGLVVDPEFRGLGKPGKQLSFVRFLFIGMHRAWFRDTILAELLPPLLKDQKSLLWEALGRKLTGLSYQEADRLSRQNKEFIKELFPTSDIYATLFSRRVQAVIGKVGPETQGVRRMLEQIGFRYVERIDPFDGGPHFEAKTEDISLVRNLRRCSLIEKDLESEMDQALVGLERPGSKNRFRAVKTATRIDGDKIALPRLTKEMLGLKPGETVRVFVIPFE